MAAPFGAGQASEPGAAEGAVSFEYDGARFRLRAADPNDHIIRVVRATASFYERDLLERLRAELRERPRGSATRTLGVDAGAYIGNHAVYFSRLCELDEVIAFEPNPAVSSVLATNIEDNGVADRVRVRPVALGAAAATATLGSPDPRNLGRSTLVAQAPGAAGGPAVEIPVVSLDAEIPPAERKGLALIKIDVEGFEVEVLRGASDCLRAARPILSIEANGARQLLRVLAEVRAYGYEIVDCLGYTPTYVLRAVRGARARRALAHFSWILWAGTPRWLRPMRWCLKRLARGVSR